MPQLQHAAYNFDAKQMQIWCAHLNGSMRALPTAGLKLWSTCPAGIITIELTKPVKRPFSSSSSSAAAAAMLPSMTQAEMLLPLPLQFDMHVLPHLLRCPPARSLEQKIMLIQRARAAFNKTRTQLAGKREEGRGEEGTYWNWMTDQMTDGLTACQPEQLKQNGSARKMPSQYSPSHSHSYSHSFRIRFILKCSWCRAFYSRSYVFIWITIFSFSVWVCVCVNCIVDVDNAKWHGYFFILFFSVYSFLFLTAHR